MFFSFFFSRTIDRIPNLRPYILLPSNSVENILLQPHRPRDRKQRNQRHELLLPGSVRARPLFIILYTKTFPVKHR